MFLQIRDDQESNHCHGDGPCSFVITLILVKKDKHHEAEW